MATIMGRYQRMFESPIQSKTFNIFQDGGRSENLEWRVILRQAGAAAAVF